MFSIVTLLQTRDTAIRVSYKEKHVDFIISAVIATKGKPKIETENQFTILNAYLDYKGDKFKEQFFQIMVDSWNEVMSFMDVEGVTLLPHKAVKPIVDLMDFADIFNFVKNVFRLPPPKHLQTVFEEKIEKDARGSRDQTYLKDDYLELATLVLIIKATIGPICLYAKIKETQIRQEFKEYILFYLYRNNPTMYNYPPMVKLRKFTEKLIEQSDNGSFEERKRVLDKGVPVEETPIYLLGIVVVQKLATAALVDDDENKNIINKIYNYVNSKLKATNTTAKTIRDKEPMSDTDSASGDKESQLESLRVHGDQAPGMAIEMDWAVDTPEKILSQLPDSMKAFISNEVLKEALEFTKGFQTATIERCNIDMLCFIFKPIMDPRSLEYIKLDSIINLLAVGYTYLYGLGFKDLAILLVSTSIEDIFGMVTINTTINKPRLSKELKEKLDALYPYRRQINDGTSENLCEKAISELVKEYESKNWKSLASGVEIPTAENMYVIPQDLKVQLAEFIIKHEGVVYGRMG